MCLGVLASALVSPANIALAAIASALLYLYSWRAKSFGLIGNLIIALLSFLSIIYGAIAFGAVLRALIPGVYAFLIILGREFIKGLEDIEGDAKYGVSTIANTYGVKAAVASGLASLAAVVAISPLPIIVDFCTRLIPYMIFAFLGVDAPIIMASYIVLKDPVRNAWRATRILKIPLLCGLLAFLVGCL